MKIKSWLLGLIVTLASVLTLPAYAWPEVDHMNMCGAPTKAVHGGWNGWGQHDRYVAKRGSAYYLRTNCPNIVAPVKKKKKVYNYKKPAARKVAKVYNYKKPSVRKVAKVARAAKAIKRISKRSSYNEKLDCARVDRMNGYR